MEPANLLPCTRWSATDPLPHAARVPTTGTNSIIAASLASTKLVVPVVAASFIRLAAAGPVAAAAGGELVEQPERAPVKISTSKVDREG